MSKQAEQAAREAEQATIKLQAKALAAMAAGEVDPTTVKTEPKPVKVYVRLGDDEHERTIAFRIPDGMDPIDLLERGATIDGNQAILTVEWVDAWVSPDGESSGGDCYTCPNVNSDISRGTFGSFSGKSMARVLGDCQRGLVRFFKERGYTVQFA